MEEKATPLSSAQCVGQVTSGAHGLFGVAHRLCLPCARILKANNAFGILIPKTFLCLNLSELPRAYKMALSGVNNDSCFPHKISSKQYWEQSQEMSFHSLRTSRIVSIPKCFPLFCPLTNPSTQNLSCLLCKRMVFIDLFSLANEPNIKPSQWHAQSMSLENL